MISTYNLQKLEYSPKNINSHKYYTINFIITRWKKQRVKTVELNIAVKAFETR